MKLEFRALFGILALLLSANILCAQSSAPPKASSQIDKPGSFGGVPGLGVDNSTTPTALNIPFSISVKGPSPWLDIKAYGGHPRNNFTLTAPASTTANSATVNLTSSPIDFANGDGIVIWKAGAPTRQNIPAAPTVTSPAVSRSDNHGSTSISYQCVGVDGLGGLTAASPKGSVTTSGVFGNLPIPIGRISRSSHVVTVNFKSPIKAAVNQHIVISGVKPEDLNGLFSVSSAPTNSQITFAQIAPDEVGMPSDSAIGRLVNAYNIKAISRSGNTVTVTTDEDQNFVVGAPTSPTIVIIDGVTPFEFSGEFILASVPAPNQFTYQMGNSGTLTGSASGTATVWEHNVVSCPAVVAPTIQYYVYGNADGSMKLIGKTLYGENTFKDWGPWVMHGYIAPAYVPTTPPGVPQNQIYTGTILSGAGTNKLTVSPLTPSAVSSTTALHDDGVALAAAAAAASQNFDGSVFLSPGPAVKGPSYYVINSPVTIPGFIGLIVGAPLIVNETVTLGGSNRLIAPWTGSVPVQGSPFPLSSYQSISGLANPQLYNANGSINIDGLAFSGSSNVQNSIYFAGPYNSFSNSAFGAAGADGFTQSASIPVVLSGGGFSQHFRNTAWSANSAFGNGPAAGQPYNAPSIPWLLVKTVPSGNALSGLAFDGLNTGVGRGIMLDFSNVPNGNSIYYDLQNVSTFQAPLTPFLMLYGQNCAAGFAKVKNVVMDSHFMAVVANWNPCFQDIYLEGLFTTGSSPMLTGSPIHGVTAFNNLAVNVGQNFDVQNNASSAGINPGGGTVSLTGNVQGRPLNFSQPNNYPAFWEQPPVSGVTARFAVGSLSIGTWTFCISSVGWNNGESAPVCAAPLALNGKQGASISWTGISEVQGYNVYAGIGGVVKQNTRPVVSSPITISSFGNQGTAPSYSGTGLPLIDNTQVATPLLRLVNGVNKADLTAGSLTGNREQMLQDVSGSVPVVIYSTPSASTNASISATTMATAGASGNLYRFSAYISQTAAGAGCTGSALVQMNLIFTDPGASSPGTLTIGSSQLANGNDKNGFTVMGNGAVGSQLVYTIPTTIFARAGTGVGYSTNFTNGTGCSLQSSYKVYPVLEQLK